MSEATIRLPRSGVVLNDCTTTAPDFRVIISGLMLRIYRDYHNAWNAVTWGGGYNVYKTQEEAVADLDARVLELRRALAPEGARELVARTLYAHLAAQQYAPAFPAWETLRDSQRGFQYAQADAVLAALGLGGDA